MTRILAIDPGIDATGLAGFDASGGRRIPRAEDAMGRLLLAEVVETKPSEPLAARLHAIGSRVAAAVRELGASVVVIEIPRKGGLYKRNTEAARHGGSMLADPLAEMHRATGAIAYAAAAAGAAVRFERASTVPKAIREHMVENALRAARREVTTRGKRTGRILADLVDAIFLGATVLATEAHA